MYLHIRVADSVVPSHSIGNQAGGSGALASVYGVEVGVSSSADNATYCQGIQPITIEPMDCEGDNNDVEPLTYAQTVPAGVASMSTTAAGRRPGTDVAAQPAMRVVYCGTVSGEQLLQQNALRDLAHASNSSTPASNVNPSEPRGRNSLHDGTLAHPVSVECMPADTGIADSSTPDSGRKAVTVQRRNSDRSTSSHAQSATSPSNAGPSTSRKSTSGSKSRRALSLDGETTAVRRRSVRTLILPAYTNLVSFASLKSYKSHEI